MAESSTILKGAVSTSKANSKVKYIVGGVVIVALIAYLIGSAMKEGGSYSREVREVLAQQNSLVDKNLRVSGNVLTESVSYNSARLDLNFTIADPVEPDKQLSVYFHGVQPDQITREGATAIVEGKLGPNGVIEANNLMLKCPSRYEEQGIEEIKVEAIK